MVRNPGRIDRQTDGHTDAQMYGRTLNITTSPHDFVDGNNNSNKGSGNKIFLNENGKVVSDASEVAEPTKMKT